jgi:hypothetical protein
MMWCAVVVVDATTSAILLPQLLMWTTTTIANADRNLNPCLDDFIRNENYYERNFNSSKLLYFT